MTLRTSWIDVLNAARITVGKKPINKEPSDDFKRRMLKAEHSPIRLLEYQWVWEDLPYYVAMHFARHHEGVEKFICTQRTDRTASHIDRHDLPQDAPITMMMVANAQALINISKVRLCKKAAKETREAWISVLDAIKTIDPIMAEFMVPQCQYRGKCIEIEPCKNKYYFT